MSASKSNPLDFLTQLEKTGAMMTELDNNERRTAREARKLGLAEMEGDYYMVITDKGRQFIRDFASGKYTRDQATVVFNALSVPSHQREQFIAAWSKAQRTGEYGSKPSTGLGSSIKRAFTGLKKRFY